MKKLLLLVAFGFAATFGSAQDCFELFISEYVEGWGNNKSLEIYNPTPNPINLSNYRLERYSNGSSTAGNNQRYTLPNQMIEPYSTWVITIDKRNPEGEGQEQPVWTELQEKTDHFANPVYNDNNTMYFNGNDAMVLRNISQGGNGYPIDVIGRIGEDPGHPPLGGGWNDVPPAFTWAANDAIAWTTDHSLIRKFDVTIGFVPANNVPWDVSVQWDSINAVITGPEGFLVGNWESLGWHDCACDPLSTTEKETAPGKLFPNPVGASQMLRFSAPYQTVRYEIFDINGKRVAAEIVGNMESFEIGTAKLGKGVYVLRTYTSGSAYVNKFVVQ